MPIPSYSIIDYSLLLKFGSIKNPPTIMSYFSPFYMTSMTSIFLNSNSSPQIFILLLIWLQFCMHSSKQSIPSIFLGDLLNYWANIQMAKARYPWPVPMSRILGLGLSLSWDQRLFNIMEWEKMSVMVCPLLILLGLLSYTLVSEVNNALSSRLNTDKIAYDWTMFDFFKLNTNQWCVEPFMFWPNDIVASKAGDIPSQTEIWALIKFLNNCITFFNYSNQLFNSTPIIFTL